MLDACVVQLVIAVDRQSKDPGSNFLEYFADISKFNFN